MTGVISQDRFSELSIVITSLVSFFYQKDEGYNLPYTRMIQVVSESQFFFIMVFLVLIRFRKKCLWLL